MGHGQGERKEDKLSIAEDEAKERFKGMYQDDMREVYVLGRTAPPAAAEIEAVAKRLLWRSCRKWDGIESDCAAKDEDDAWDYAGQICGYQEDYIERAKEVLEVARKAVTE